MYKCRICLTNTSKRKLRSIFDSHNGNSYASMMMSLTNIKIDTSKEITEEICNTCSQKLIEAYDFKLLIERSDEALQNSAGVKRIYFSNLQDKIKIEIDTTKDFTEHYSSDITESFKCGGTSLVYKDTTIQKIECDVKIGKENKPMSVVDFLNTFQPDDDSNFHDFDDCNDVYAPKSDDDDPDYNLALSMRKTKVKKKKNKHVSSNKEFKKTLIKPVILRNIRVMPTILKKVDKDKCKPKNKYYKAGMCNYCGKMTTSIRTHLLTHTGVRSHKCDICSKAFFTAKALDTHKRNHTLEKKFKCDQCVAAFKSATALQSHSLMHQNEKKYVCDICSKAFKRRGALSRHKLMHNVANKCIKCDLCNMSFYNNHGLKHHLRIHTGERPYNCELCSQPYSYKHDFNRHCLKKHGVFLKRRIVYVMNEEVLQRERALMRELMIKMQGIVKEDEPLNPFSDEGPQAALAFEQAMKALKSNNIPIDLF